MNYKLINRLDPLVYLGLVLVGFIMPEVVMAFEDEFDIEIDDEELADVSTVGQAVNLLHSKI